MALKIDPISGLLDTSDVVAPQLTEFLRTNAKRVGIGPMTYISFFEKSSVIVRDMVADAQVANAAEVLKQNNLNQGPKAVQSPLNIPEQIAGAIVNTLS